MTAALTSASSALRPHPLEIYADSYAQMARMGDGLVDCRSVEADIRQNMIPVTQALVASPPSDEPAELEVASIVPEGCTSKALAFDPGVLHVNKDGSGYIEVDSDAWELEDDRCEGPDGPQGSVHWITRLPASEMQALRDFLNGVVAPPPSQAVTEALIKHMVERFLRWRLPENFSPDGGISFQRMFNENTPHPMKSEPTGTNLLDYTQATKMVSHMVEGSEALSSAPSAVRTKAADDVLAERKRQVEAEGWTAEHDDVEHDSGDLAAAGSAYALHAADLLNPYSQGDGRDLIPDFWPFSKKWWKPNDARSDLVKAGALILAEIERLDRAATKAVQS